MRRLALVALLVATCSAPTFLVDEAAPVTTFEDGSWVAADGGGRS